MPAVIEPSRFIRDNLHLLPVPLIPEISLYTAHPGSGLGRLGGRDRNSVPPSPYWAYCWAGGLALARHILDRPEIVRDRRMIDLGAGGGIVAIAAAKSGARHVIASDIDPNAIAALALNAAANGVALTSVVHDLLDLPPPAADIVAVGDLYYDRDTAVRVTAFLDRCLVENITVLIGDPYRMHLPRSRLRVVREYDVSDFGDSRESVTKRGGVFTLLPDSMCC